MVAILLDKKWYAVCPEKVVAVCDASTFALYPLPDYKGNVIAYQGQLARINGPIAKKVLILKENDSLSALFADEVEPQSQHQGLEPYTCQ